MEKWTAIFVPFCTLNREGHIDVFCCKSLRSRQVQCLGPSSSFSGRRSGQPPKYQHSTSPSSLRTHPSVQIISTTLCAVMNKVLGVLCLCKKKELEGRRNCHIDHFVVCFEDDVIVQQVVVETGWRRVPQHSHCTTHGTSMS